MKTMIVLLMSVMMFSTTGMAFEQQDLDQLQSQDQLFDHPNFDMENFSARGYSELQKFFGHRKFRCVSQNRRGRRFRAEARERRQARQRAMRQCRRQSRRPATCRVVRCSRTNGGKLNDLIDLIEKF